MNSLEYRAIPRISNSDLTAFKNRLFGIDFKIPEKAFAFGNAFHELILEPHKVQKLTEDVDIALLRHLADKVREYHLCKWYLQFSQKENIQLFTDPDTGLDCKSKLDLIYKQSAILDFKTTSARDYRSFIDSTEKYDYDRQAAFYLDSISGKKFVYIGIQKVKPYDIFYFEPDAAFINRGRKNYKALLRKWKEVHHTTVKYA